MHACLFGMLEFVSFFLDSEGKLPDDWKPMKADVTVQLVNLLATSAGYMFALSKFHKTMTQGTNYSDIVSIQRIQNRRQYMQYALKKKDLDKTNPRGTQNELWLFHGTNESAISQINETNFNRSFSKQNGTFILVINKESVKMHFTITELLFR